MYLPVTCVIYINDIRFTFLNYTKFKLGYRRIVSEMKRDSFVFYQTNTK